MANLLSSFLNGSSTLTYNNGTNVIPSYTLVQPTFSNTSTGASIFNQTFGSSSSFGNSLLFGSSLGGSTLTGSFGNSFNVGGFNTSFNYGSLGNGFGFGTIARTSTTTTTTTPSGTTIATKQVEEDASTANEILGFATSDFAYANGDAVVSMQVTDLPDYGTLQLNGVDVVATQLVLAADFDNLTYTPDADFSGSDWISVRLSSDGVNYDTSNSNVSVVVTPTDDVPTISEVLPIVVSEGDIDSSIGQTLIDTFADIDGDTLDSITITSLANSVKLHYTTSTGVVVPVIAGMTITAADAVNLTYTAPPAGSVAATQQHFIGYTVTDSTGDVSAGGTLQLTIVDGNDAPVVDTYDSSLTADENQTDTISGTLPVITDPDGDTLTFSITGTDAAAFSVNSTGTISLAAAQDYEALVASGSAVLSANLVASDGQLSATEPFTLTIQNVLYDEAPSITSVSSFTVSEPSTSVGTVKGVDPDTGDSDTLSYSISGGADSASFTIDNSGNLTFSSAPDFDAQSDFDSNNVYEVEITVSDRFAPTANTDVQMVRVTVEGIVDEEPTFSNASLGAGAESGVTTEEALTVNISENIATGTIVFDLDYTDGELNSNADTGVVSYSLTGSSSSNFEIDPDTGEISVVTALDYVDGAASYPLTVKIDDVADSAQSSATTTVTVKLIDGNDAPELTNLSGVVVSEDASYTFVNSTNLANQLGFTDSNSDGFAPNSWSVVTAPSYGTFNLSTLTYTPNPDYNGEDSVTLTVMDNNPDPLVSNTATITFNVSDSPDAPTLYGNGVTVASAASASTVAIPRDSAGFEIATFSVFDPDNTTYDDTDFYVIADLWDGGTLDDNSDTGQTSPTGNQLSVSNGALVFVDNPNNNNDDYQDSVVEVQYTDEDGMRDSWFINIDFY